MNYLVYQSYGNKDILNECCYSILSLLKHGLNKKAVQVIIYTDQPGCFSFLPSEYIQFVVMDAITIEAYKGPHSFIHRLKIKVLEDCINRFDGNILYVDSDIYFLKPVDDLFTHITEHSFLMCNNEGAIHLKTNIVFDKFSVFIKKNKTYLEENTILIPQDVIMWNAGVIGFPSSKKKMIADVLNTNDIIFEKFRSHVVEQLSFSYQLQQNGMVQKSTDYVFHYWNFKEFRAILLEFFNHHRDKSSLETMIQDVDSIRPDLLIKPKMEYESLSFFRKNLRKLYGKNRWQLPAYTIGK
ncbi:MAG: hypothetical protein H7259_02110 [Cytophagales bacterium]|nr:hypothetical protein [Cytophaga sp.]